MKTKIVFRNDRTEIIKSKKVKLTDDWVEFKDKNKEIVAMIAMDCIQIIKVL